MGGIFFAQHDCFTIFTEDLNSEPAKTTAENVLATAARIQPLIFKTQAKTLSSPLRQERNKISDRIVSCYKDS